MFLIALYISSIAFALGYSVALYPQLPLPLKVLTFVIGLGLLGECAGFLMYRYIETNLPVYNVVLLGEYMGYAYFYKLVTRISWIKKTAHWFVLLFPLFWCISIVWFSGLLPWNSYVFISGCVFVIFFALSYFYQAISDDLAEPLHKKPEFWISTGLILFYTANLPFLGMYNFLINHYVELAEQLGDVLRVMNIIMYSLFAYAFICHRTAIMK